MMQLRKGDTFRVPVTRRDSANALVNLAGWTVTAAIKNQSKVTIQTLTVTHTTTGVVMVSATAAQTALWPVGELIWNVKYLAPDGTVDSIDAQHLRVLEQIT